MKKKILGVFVCTLLIATSIATANGEEDIVPSERVRVEEISQIGEDIVLIFSDDFNDNYLDLENWAAFAVPSERVRVEEINQRVEIDIEHIYGQYGSGGINLLQDFTGEGIFEVDLQNGFSYNYLYKYLRLYDEEDNYNVMLEFFDWGPIGIAMMTPEHPNWMNTILFNGDHRNWNWLFHLKLIRNSDGTFTGIVTDEYGHHFEGTTSLTVPLDVPLRPGLIANKWLYGYPDMIFYDNFKVYGIPEEIEVDIDIKPGSYPNSINPKSKGNVPVAILTTDDFDASDVGPATIVFLDATPIQWAMDDVDFDGDLDMILHFKTQELDF
ncbi:MAG: hypothetical protein KAJ44_06735, partial [Thermoplasmatales archaeon]|nr:hypothetical protein [Thermoplasmatales archaeon]